MPAKLVIIAVSGRALAHSAAKRRERVAVLDAFADRDTRAIADAASVAADEGVALDPKRLLAALAAHARGSALDIVIGSGVEDAPGLVTRIAGHGCLYANPVETVAALKDPELGLAILRATGWRVPLTQLEPPADPGGWLEKDVGGTGGGHVRRAGHARTGARVYFQREIPGRPMSVTFLADGARAWLLGFNRLRVEARGEAEFCYAGAVGNILVDARLRARTQACLDRLVRATGLRGLAGVDFLLDADEPVAIEINPRPTATFELYDDDFAEGLVHWHMLSFERAIPDFAARLGGRSGGCRALGIVYADRPIRIPADATFPDWCRDLPCAGTVIAASAPVLSVCSGAANGEEAERELEARSEAMRGLLDRWTAPDRRVAA